jgi:hypothetical protein
LAKKGADLEQAGKALMINKNEIKDSTEIT